MNAVATVALVVVGLLYLSIIGSNLRAVLSAARERIRDPNSDRRVGIEPFDIALIPVLVLLAWWAQGDSWLFSWTAMLAATIALSGGTVVVWFVASRATAMVERRTHAGHA